MHKRILGIGLGLAALLAGSQATQFTPTPQATTAQMMEEVAQSIEQPTKPAPAQPDACPVPQCALAIQAWPLFPALGTRFIEKLHLRKVKYGKHRWVMV
jgi:hypothetical protein